MKNECWTTFSFTESLRPQDGWKTENAILATYSADLVVIVTALLALTGCDLENRRTGSRVELVKAVEALCGRVRILAQANRVPLPKTYRPILKLMDRFLSVIPTDENIRSWHPKVVFVRYQRTDDPTDRQWRVWVGSRNLTNAMNWEAGLVLTSRADGGGQSIEGLAELGGELARRANLKSLNANDVSSEIARLRWDCPAGCEVKRITLYGPEFAKGFPIPPSDTEKVIVISPFLDSETMDAVSKWGNLKTHRTLVSTAFELQRLWRDNNEVFNPFTKVLVQPFPEIIGEGADPFDEIAPEIVETTEDEDLPPAGLHAKLFLAIKGTRRQLWLGSANATERGWEGRNFETVAELSISREAAGAIEEFGVTCPQFKSNPAILGIDEDEEVIEQARKLLSGGWSLRQVVGENDVQVNASAPPPISNLPVQLEVAALGGPWNVWPNGANDIMLTGLRQSQRSDFLQVRLLCGETSCAWLQIAPCDQRPDEDRDHALIAQYLDPRTFLLWLRSVLADEPARAGGGDWDDEEVAYGSGTAHTTNLPDAELMPSIEEILRAWSRDSAAFNAADEKVRAYLSDLERRAAENNQSADVELLQTFRKTWSTLASELR